MIKIIKGDLIHLFKRGDFDAIGHGCNCFKTLSDGTSGGIGATISDNFQTARLADEDTKHGDPRKLGTYSIGFSKVGGNKLGLILNCYTQYYPGKNISYVALRNSFRLINKNFKGKRIGLPWIGCGIAGGDKILVFTYIKELLCDVDVTIVEYK